MVRKSLMVGSLIVSFGAAALALQATREEVLELIFPGARIHAETLFLTEGQRRKAAEISGVEVPSLLIARYLATGPGEEELGRAYVDTHVVRTKRESLLVCLDARGKVMRVEVTAFMEPPEYRAPDRWYQQYEGKVLEESLYLDRAIRPLAGATLTARATNEAVRRVLALDQVLHSEERP